jgi:hypothetical protein
VYLVDQGSKVTKSHNHDECTEGISESARSAYIVRKNSRLKKTSIGWIERLEQTSLSDHRKYCIWRILAPYFINIKHLSFDESFNRIYQWLDKCNELRQLDFDPEPRINGALNRAINTNYLPISFDNRLKEPRTLKIDNRELYDILLLKAR